MALNKFMHPRNLYKTPPDFAKLAKSFEEFASISKTDVAGKVTIDFKNPHSLRVLTKCLLKSDFGLDVVIPEDRLVPTLPLRLNYILWIEDLLNSIDRMDSIRGLDIGTGACAIYPLLAAVKNKWHMVGTESDQESLQKAKENIEKNNLQELIQVKKNPGSTLLEYIFTEDNSVTFDFCMCNPPFYSNVQELCESRSPARLPPKNGFTGSPQELITEGGELTFCRKMIKESAAHKDKILIFSTMVGHKYNMKELVQDLKADGIKHTSTEFCQGRVTRWGLAWTYQHYDIDKLVPGRDKPRKKSVPVVYLLPELQGSVYDIETVSKKLLETLQNLKICYKILNKKRHQLVLDVKATENTWSNQRRKRRMMILQQAEAKKPKLKPDVVERDGTSNMQLDVIDDIKITSLVSTDHSQGLSKKQVESSKSEVKNCQEEKYKVNNQNVTSIRNQDPVEIPSTSLYNETIESEKKLEAELKTSDKDVILVHAFFKILKKENDILLEMEILDGIAGKEGVHQIMQFIKNNWK